MVYVVYFLFVKRSALLPLLIGLMAFGGAQANSAFSMRLGYGKGLGLTLGAGYEVPLHQNLVLDYGAEVAPDGPGFLAHLRLAFKPDLGRYAPGLAGIHPYLGGGLAGILGGGSTLGLDLGLGLEVPVDSSTALYAEAFYLYGVRSLPKYWHFGLGLAFR